jgi:beta-1,4-N-acetylglucosaminyltransferase
MTSQVHRKLCFITVGATANFDLLIRASVDLSFLQYLSAQGYTDLFLQHGKNGDKLLRELLPEVAFTRDDPVVNDLSAVVNDIKISSFDFRKEGLQKEMLAARGGSLAFRDAGVVICHAGMSSSCYREHCTRCNFSQATTFSTPTHKLTCF